MKGVIWSKIASFTQDLCVTENPALNTLLHNLVFNLPKWQIVDSSKLKEFADNNFEFNGYGRKSSERAENTVGKGEIAHYKQFFLFPQCFQKTGKNLSFFRKGLNDIKTPLSKR